MASRRVGGGVGVGVRGSGGGFWGVFCLVALVSVGLAGGLSVSTPLQPRMLARGPSAAGKAMMEEYIALHRSIVRGEVEERDRRFLVWNVRDLTGMGLGNRLIGFVSALALAMSTRRALVVNKDQILGSAFALSEGPLELRANAEALRSVSGRVVLGMGHEAMEILTCYPWLVPDTPVTPGSLPPRSATSSASLRKSDFPMESDTMWAGLRKKDLSRGFEVESTQYSVTALAHNPTLRPWFQAHFGDAVEFYRAVVPFLLRLTPKAQYLLDKAAKHVLGRPKEGVDAEGWFDGPVVGLQVRTEHLSWVQEEFRTFMRCAEMAAVEVAAQQLHRAVVTPDGSLSLPQDDAEGWQAQKKTRFFLATDKGAVVQVFRKHFGDQLVTLSNLPGDSPGSLAAVLDMMLLGRCDDAVITWPRSTFGISGAALSPLGRPPLTVLSGHKGYNRCVRQLSNEPCYHGWAHRWKTACYSRQVFETPETIGRDNCYQCRQSTCPGDDESDTFNAPFRPFEYAARADMKAHKKNSLLLPSITAATPTERTRNVYNNKFKDTYGPL